MREPPYKAYLNFDPNSRSWRSQLAEWLEENNRTDHFLNAYLCGNPLRPKIIVVLNDRTTAIMLKLALG